jgi:hypothetical protein
MYVERSHHAKNDQLDVLVMEGLVTGGRVGPSMFWKMHLNLYVVKILGMVLHITFN